jgi:hypothetical protein
VSTSVAYGPTSAVELQRQQVAALLQQSYSWTRAASTVVPTVAQQVAPALMVAAQLYEAQQYPAALSQLAGVAAMVDQTRRVYPTLPGL